MIFGFNNFLINESKRYNIISDINSIELYHGSKHYFEKFKFQRHGYSDSGWLGRGVYFTNDIEYAESYSEPDGYLYTVKLNIQKPYILMDYAYSRSPNKLANKLNVNNSIELTTKLKNMGYDSVILTYDENMLDSGIFYEVCLIDDSLVNIIDIEEKEDE